MSKKIPHQAKISQGRAAGMARATAGRARTFEGKKGPRNADDEINEALADLAEIATPEKKRQYTKDQAISAFIDVLDGCRGPHEIQANTGLPSARCEEIYKIWAAALAGKLIGED
jgi:hypothetical protein